MQIVFSVLVMSAKSAQFNFKNVGICSTSEKLKTMKEHICSGHKSAICYLA